MQLLLLHLFYLENLSRVSSSLEQRDVHTEVTTSLALVFDLRYAVSGELYLAETLVIEVYKLLFLRLLGNILQLSLILKQLTVRSLLLLTATVTTLLPFDYILVGHEKFKHLIPEIRPLQV